MKLEKKKIVPVLFWLVSIIVEIFIANIIIKTIYVYIFMYKETYWYILETVVYTIFGIVVIVFKRFKENKSLLQFTSFKFSSIIKIFLIDITAIALLQWGGFRGFNNFQNMVQKSFVYFFNRFTGKESFTLYTIFRTDFIYDSLLIQRFITTITIIPIYEELIFRGLIYNDTKKLFNTKIAVLVSSLLFGLAHFRGGYSQIAIAMVIGLLSVYCYEKTKNLYAPILFHSLHNFMSVIVYGILDWHVYVILVLICMLACIIMLFVEAGRYIAKRKKNNALQTGVSFYET